jgi:hypothetical protein
MISVVYIYICNLLTIVTSVHICNLLAKIVRIRLIFIYDFACVSRLVTHSVSSRLLTHSVSRLVTLSSSFTLYVRLAHLLCGSGVPIPPDVWPGDIQYYNIMITCARCTHACIRIYICMYMHTHADMNSASAQMYMDVYAYACSSAF